MYLRLLLAANILEYGAACAFKIHAILGTVTIGINEYILAVQETERILHLKESENVFRANKLIFIPVGVEQQDPQVEKIKEAACIHLEKQLFYSRDIDLTRHYN